MPPTSSRIDTHDGGGLAAESTLAIVLGASEWPEYDLLTGSPAFRNSAHDLAKYFLASDGLNLAPDNLLDLFDDDSAASVQNRRIGRFLKDRGAALKGARSGVNDLLIVYIGHGGFVPNDRDAYFLALRTTQKDAEGVSGYRVSDLAKTVLDSARFARRYLIFDCCFSASAYSSFQSSGPLALARVKTLDVFPNRGTALLCSSGSRDPSKAPAGQRYTMFSDALLKVLRDGSPFHTGSRWLSLEDLGDAVREMVRESYPEKAVRPEVHSPDQREGDIAEVPLFLNRSFVAWDDSVIAPASLEVTVGRAVTPKKDDQLEPSDSIVSLIAALRNNDSSVVGSAGRRLAAVGAAALPSLLTALSDANDAVVLAAVWTLGMMGNAAGDAKDDLLQVFHSRTGEIRLASAEALLASNATSDLPLDVLGEALRSGVAPVRYVALQRLREKGPAAVPHFCRALAHRKSVVEIVSVLKEMGLRIDDASILEMLRSLAALLRGASNVLANSVLSGGNLGRLAMPEVYMVRDLITGSLPPRYGTECLLGIIGLLPFADTRGQVAEWALNVIDAVPQAIRILEERAFSAPAEAPSTVRSLERLGARAVPGLRWIAKHSTFSDAREQARHALRNLEGLYVSPAERAWRALLLVITAPLGIVLLPYGVARMWSQKERSVMFATAMCIGAVAGIAVASAAVRIGLFPIWKTGLWSLLIGLAFGPALAASVIGANDIYAGVFRITWRTAKPAWWEPVLQGAFLCGAVCTIGAELLFRQETASSLFGTVGALFGAVFAAWPRSTLD